VVDATPHSQLTTALDEEACVTYLLLSTRGRIIHTLRGLPTAVPTRICLINGSLLFTGHEEIVDAANRGDVVSVQVEDEQSEGATWSVVVTGRVSLADAAQIPPALVASLERGASLLALPLTVVYGQREA